MKRKYLAIAFFCAVFLIGVSLYISRAGENGHAAKLVNRSSERSDIWPESRSWIWNVDPVATKQQVGVCIRTTESKIPKGTTPGFPIVPQMPLIGSERHGGWCLVGDQRLAGRVSCQVIDFHDVGLGEPAGKKPLRLLVRLRIGGTLTGITGQESILDGETFAASTEIEPKWVDDELHFLTVYTRTEDTVYAHHAILQQRDEK